LCDLTAFEIAESADDDACEPEIETTADVKQMSCYTSSQLLHYCRAVILCFEDLILQNTLHFLENIILSKMSVSNRLKCERYIQKQVVC